jgi:hypothetical protein
MKYCLRQLKTTTICTKSDAVTFVGVVVVWMGLVGHVANPSAASSSCPALWATSYVDVVDRQEVLLPSPGDLSPACGGCVFNSCSALSAWASSSSIFFSSESRCPSKAAAVRSPRWSSFMACSDCQSPRRETMQASHTSAKSASGRDPVASPFCSFDMVW